MKQAQKQGNNNKTGAIGEKIAANWLERQGHRIITVNYLRKCGEIDIVSRETLGNEQITHFIEVKTVSYETKTHLQQAIHTSEWRPEENVTHNKLQRLHRTIDLYIQENALDTPWQLDVAAVRVVPHEKYATINFLPNVIL